MRVTAGKLMLAASLALALSLVSGVTYVLMSRPSAFQISADFEASSHTMGGRIEASLTRTSSFHLRPTFNDGTLRLSFSKSIDWPSSTIVIMSCSQKGSGIYDRILYESKESEDIQLLNLTILHIATKGAEVEVHASAKKSFFMNDPVRCFVLDQASTASIAIPGRRIELFLDAIMHSGTIRLGKVFEKTVTMDRIGVLLKLEPLRSVYMDAFGNFTIFQENWIDSKVETWNEGVDASFHWPGGGISFYDSMQHLDGGRDLNLAKMKGRMRLVNHNESVAYHLEGRVQGISINGLSLTEPSIYKLLGTPPFSYLLYFEVVLVLLVVLRKLGVTFRVEGIRIPFLELKREARAHALRILPGIRCYLQSTHFQEYREASLKTILIEAGSTQSCELKVKTYGHIPSVTEHVVFDIANDSLSDITVHECRVYMEHPEKIEFKPIMLFDESDLCNAQKEMRPPKRRLLRPKERMTIQSDLAGRGVYRFDLYTTELENSRYFMFLRGPNWIAFCDSDQRITESTLERAEKESSRVASST